MNLSGPFIRRPVATTLVMLAIVVFGLMAYVRLPVSALPDVDFPTIVVTANLPGADAETMAASVATTLEREFSTIDGVDSMTSSSSLGATRVTLQFDLDRNVDSAAQDVQSAISRAARRLPPDMPTPPSFRKVNPADEPILFISLSSATLPLYQVNEYAETRLSQSISTVRGVAQVQIYGSQKYAVRVRLDPEKLASRGMGLSEVSRAIKAANVNLPTGTLYSENRTYVLQANGALGDAAAYRRIIVGYKNGAPVRIEDLGQVTDGVETDKVAAWRGTRTTLERSIVLAIQKQPGANTVEVAKKVLAMIPRLREEIPASVNLEVLSDRSESVKESVEDVEYTLLLTLALVILVIFAFLRRVRATIIPSLSMPLALLGTFTVMYLLGYTLDNLSLMALTLSVGFVVDDAIVVLENIVRHRESGKSPLQAALDGSQEIGFTVVSMTISLVAVFIPFLFMGGILGRLFEEFAVTITVAILVSGFVSLTLTPMLAARMLGKGGPTQTEGWFFRVTERGFSLMHRAYQWTLGGVLRRPSATLIGSAVLLGGMVVLFQKIPKGFLPSEDTGRISITTEGVEGSSFEAMGQRQLEVAKLLQTEPAVANFMVNIGRDGANSGRAFVQLRPRSERADSAMAVMSRLRQKLSQIAGLRVFVQLPPPIRIGGTSTKSEYQLVLQSTDTAELYQQAGILQAELTASPILRDVATDALLSNPQLTVKVDRDRASSLGISLSEVEESLYNAYGSRQISTIYSAVNTYAVILELDPKTQKEPSALERLYLTSSTGEAVPLGAVADIVPGTGPSTVNHLGQLPSVTLSFNVVPGHSLSEAVEVAEKAAARVLPAQVTARFQGDAEAFVSSLRGLGLLLGVAVLVIYLVLGILYESTIHPLTILSALPFAGFGALVTLMAFGSDLNVYAFVGVIMLVGLVKKNGIMMVDYAIEQRRDPGVTAKEAITRACLVRFRPIMMTTMAALLGTLPIAMGLGAGAEARQPLGLAVVGGLLFSQLLTMYVTPVFYVLLEGLRGRWGAR